MESSDFTSANTGAGANEGTSTNSSNMGAGEGGAMSSARERLADVGSTVREKASGAKDSLANALEAGAERLRARSGDGMSAAGASGGSMAVADDRMAQMSGRVAGGMEGAAEWLRDADLDGLKSSIETQVKEHPGRTLLIAVGLGYLLGKALRK